MKKIILSMLLIGACSEKPTHITLLHINDTHSKHLTSIREKEGTISTNGGSAQLAKLIKEHKLKNTNTLMIHGGDAVTGSAHSIVFKGQDSTDVLNLTGIDIAVLGNHEFDFGLKQAYQILNSRNFPTIAINAYEKETGNAIVPSSYTTNISGKSIGFIGVLTADEVYTLKDKQGQFVVSNVMSSLSNELQNTNYQTNDLLILVSHSGYELDKKIAETFPNVFDVIIGGHSHTYLEQPTKINNTLIVQVNNNIKELGKLDLFISKNNTIKSYKYQAIPIVNIGYDKDVNDYLMSIQGDVDKEMGAILAEISDSISDENIRKESTLLGNFIVDMTTEALDRENLDLLMLNSGGIRSSINKGNITLGTMYEIHPFDNTLVYFETTGKGLKEILNHSASTVYGEGGFLQLSKGTEVTVKNKVVTSIKLQEKEINDDETYNIIVTDWVFNGGDGYTMIKENASNIQFLGFDVREFLMNALKNKKYIDVNKLDSKPRWIIQ